MIILKINVLYLPIKRKCVLFSFRAGIIFNHIPRCLQILYEVHNFAWIKKCIMKIQFKTDYHIHIYSQYMFKSI